MRIVARPRASPVGAWLAAGGVFAAAGIRLAHLDRLPFPVCTFRALTGLPCMSCGSTRAMGLLGRLEPAAAFRMQPLATVAALLVLVWGLADLALLFRRRALRLECTQREGMVLTWTALGLVLANWAYLLLTLR
jgi:hypothetical protein